jgi:hypothetical protein
MSLQRAKQKGTNCSDRVFVDQLDTSGRVYRILLVKDACTKGVMESFVVVQKHKCEL